jgi:glyoxylase-like metal-dependent hydrolase (beta-lactamase superfamily II)
MKRVLYLLIAGTVLSGAAAMSASSEPAGSVKLWRIDCGDMRANDLNAFSDTNAYTGKKMRIVASCYLIKHGEQYMLWDTGLPAATKGAPLNDKDTFSVTLAKTLPEQLDQIGVTPDDISIVGISHYHFDHIGQLASFPKAKLLIGAADWAAMKASPPPFGLDPSLAKPWLVGGALVEPVSGDKDVFGDGSVTMLDMPGHTPGHHALLIRLGRMGPVLLSGDVAHFRENYDSDGVPAFNTNRADTKASLDRFKGLAKNLNATVVIQHDARDIAKLPAFPNAAE